MNRDREFVGKKLPFKKPEVQTYPYFTGIIGILLGNKKEYTWVYNNYILIWVMKEKYNIDYWADFKYGNEEIQKEFCPMLDKLIITREEIKKNYNDIRDAITFFVSNNMYSFISVDVYYIKEWWGEEQERKHIRHQLLILGYDEMNDEILIADFINKKYNTIIVPFNEFEKGYNNVESYTPYEDFGKDLWLLTINKSSENLNLGRIIMLMEDFLSSSDKTLINHIQLENKEEKYVFGLAAISELKRYCIYALDENINYLDIRVFHILVEMHCIMSERLKYIEDIYGDNKLFEEMEVLELNESLLKKIKIVQGMAIKYNYTDNKDILIRMSKCLEEFEIYEKEFLEKCIALLKIIQNK